MKFRSDARIDQSKVRYGGGSSGGGPRIGRGAGVSLGSVALLVVVFLGARFFNIDLSGLVGDTGFSGGSTVQATAPECRTGADVERNPDCRWPAYSTAIDTFWGQQVRGYRSATTRLYSGQVRTGCGAASSQLGPFYCPADETVYIDTDFMGKLLRRLGARGGYAAEAYVMAHEFGHHLQQLDGTNRRARSMSGSGPASGAVRQELQADCYAGVWFHHVNQGRDALIEDVTADDLNRIVDAARAVGDDHIQQQSGGGVSPESWTHGSSAQRQHWVQVGFDSGNPASCDTFATNDLGPN
ncbi:neutral zinc metallopeptidase [Tessaracoccus sp. OH4464_COT-324]|uniref:KPN_02809 family neutral zinc metallopeptidase n=1 Tax=Tessaracoccus sp. OH4464_COT-324 TaxID=2491059 RepID=UPI000F632F68|nr:neutral zinc metallopeptidase [Tessaracoccus sp. OH4464_COT-324]RRD45245.1 hypothetical protein EII42_11160 [Tessaracoccus sp. OH4464_COT-324]